MDTAVWIISTCHHTGVKFILASFSHYIRGQRPFVTCRPCNSRCWSTLLLLSTLPDTTQFSGRINCTHRCKRRAFTSQWQESLIQTQQSTPEASCLEISHALHQPNPLHNCSQETTSSETAHAVREWVRRENKKPTSHPLVFFCGLVDQILSLVQPPVNHMAPQLPRVLEKPYISKLLAKQCFFPFEKDGDPLMHHSAVLGNS